MESIAGFSSEQPEYEPNWHPGDPQESPITPHERARAFAMLMKRAYEKVGYGGGLTVIGQLDYILKHARERNLEASTYEQIWGIRRIFAGTAAGLPR